MRICALLSLISWTASLRPYSPWMKKCNDAQWLIYLNSDCVMRKEWEDEIRLKRTRTRMAKTMTTTMTKTTTMKMTSTRRKRMKMSWQQGWEQGQEREEKKKKKLSYLFILHHSCHQIIQLLILPSGCFFSLDQTKQHTPSTENH